MIGAIREEQNMTEGVSEQLAPAVTRSRFPIYYGWVVVGVAAIAMTMTLPGRSHGLGLITEPLIADLKIERTLVAQIKLLTTLLGAAFCIPVGYALDRFGVRSVLTAILFALGLSCVWMSHVTTILPLFLSLLLIGGFGQSALSVVSMAAVGKWFRRRIGMAMGVYTVLLSVGFGGSIASLGYAVNTLGWREAWGALGWILVGLAPLSWLVYRNSPQDVGQPLDPPAVNLDPGNGVETSYTLGQALRTPAFWIFAAGTSTYNLVWTGMTLFNQSVLEERGFGPDVAVQVMTVLGTIGLVSNLIAGAVAKRERLGILLGIGMAVLSISLALFPTISGSLALWTYAAAMGLTGGLVMVVFFAAWGQIYGRAQLGRIQGAAQVISVLASGLGPVALAECQSRLGGYGPVFYALAAVTGLLSVAAFLVKMPAVKLAVSSDAAAVERFDNARPVIVEN